MKYLLLIYRNEAAFAQMTEEQMKQAFQAFMSYTTEIGQAGVMLGMNRLQPCPTATTVRIREGKTLTTDGPFAETKEQLGGYYLIEVENLDEAIKWAERCPAARFGSIEVRPVAQG